MSGLDFKVFVVRVAEVGKGYIWEAVEDERGELCILYSPDPSQAEQYTSKEAADKLSEKIPGSVVRVRLIHEETI